MERHIEIKAGERRLAASFHYPTRDPETLSATRSPAVVVCHGFVGNRIGANRLFVRTARALADEGYAVLRFDYAGCGESDGDYGASEFVDWIDQTRFALDYVLDLDFVDPSRTTLLGHSLGGAVALLTAVRDKRVRKLALWAPVGHPFQDIVGIVGRKAYEEAVTTGKTEYAGYALGHDFFRSLAACHPFQEARGFAGDVFLAHGTADEAIPVDYSFLYQKVFRTRGEGCCDKEIVPQADHAFSTRGHAEFVVRKTIEWLRTSEQQKQDWYGWMI